jgi:Protein of unknown function (DUF2934)
MGKEPQEPKRTRKPAERKPAAKKTTTTAKPRTKAAAKPQVTEESVARHAYELYESGAEGDMLTHWLRAERELKGA